MPIHLKGSNAFSSMNLTPLIDVVLFLLIFFLVATNLEQEDRNLKVVLPSAGSAMPMTKEPEELIVSIDEKGKVFLENRIISTQELESVFRQAVSNNPANQSVIIRGDRRVPFQHVVNVMDLCNKSGVTNYSVTTSESE